LELLELHRALSRVQRMHAKLSARTPWKHPRATALDSQTVEAAIGPSLTRPGSRAAFDAAVRTVFGAEACELSMLHFLAYLSGGGGLMNLVSVSGGAQQDRIRGGAQQLAVLAAQRLQGAVVLEAPVRSVQARGARVSVHHDRGDVSARYVIVAVPPQLAARIAFEPALPAAKRHVLDGSPMGATIKVLATYARPFWRARGLSGEAVSDAPPFAVVFDNADGHRQAALLGFSVGQPARQFAALPASRRRTVAVAELCRLYGPEASDLQDYVEFDWSGEAWTLGCPVGSPRPGVLSLNGSELRSRCGRIGFAGTETAREYCGYMEGALEAAERAAGEALAMLAT
jgi:monoamine oxidase